MTRAESRAEDLRVRWRHGEPSIGVLSSTTDVVFAEALSRTGFDIVVVDMQHGGASATTLAGILQAVELGGAVPMVRVPDDAPSQVMAALDKGAVGVVVPTVESAAQAQAVAAATRYPPAGTRSLGRYRGAQEVVGERNRGALCIPMVETAAGLSNLAAIIDTAGVDAIFVGPGDLALSLGLELDLRHPELLKALARIAATAQRKRCPAGTFVTGPDHVGWALSAGFSFVVVGSDGTYLTTGAAAGLAAARSAIPSSTRPDPTHGAWTRRSPMALTHASYIARFPAARMLIGDRWVDDGSGGQLRENDPSTGEAVATLPVAGREEVDAAVGAARAALPEWAGMAADERRRLLVAIARVLGEHDDEFSTIWAVESGAPRSPWGTSFAIEYFEYYAGWVDKLAGRLEPTYPGQALDYVRYEPYGVIGALTTWNAPLLNTAMKLAPALAAGNCVVLKPSEQGALAPTRFAELCLQAGLPPGVVNVVHGGRETGELVVGHPGIDKLSFTGGIGAARNVLAAAARNVTPVVVELGGKAANIVFDDADLDAAVPLAAIMGAVQSAGQGCMLPTRLLVQDSVYDDVAKAVVDLVESVVVGDPLGEGTMMGPVISRAACDRILEEIRTARESDAGELLTGGHRLDGQLSSGNFIAPTVFGRVDNASRIAREEVFGPVLCVIPFHDEDDAVRIANDTPYGLAAYVSTNDLRRAHRVAARLDAGWVNINGISTNPGPVPFGGFKQSGYGHEGGLEGIREFLRAKNVYVPLA